MRLSSNTKSVAQRTKFDMLMVGNVENSVDIIVEMINSGAISQWLGERANSGFTQNTLSFLIAAWMHRKWVKKDITEQFGNITQAINNVADTVSRDLASHSKRIDDLSGRVSKLEKV
jgi:hypothetical protein